MGLLLWLAFRHASLAEVIQHLSLAGPVLGLVPIPSCLAQLADARACQLLLSRLQCRLPFSRVFMAQAASEAATLALPMGFLIGESLRPWLLSRGRPTTLERCIAAVAGRKSLLILTEGLVMALTLALGYDIARDLSERRLGGPLLIPVTLAMVALLVGVAILVPALLRSGRFADSLFGGLLRVLPRRLRPVLEQKRHAFSKTDTELVRVFRLPLPQLLSPGLLYLGVWLLEGLELWLVLRLLGTKLPLEAALLTEALVATLRALMPLLPAGIGIQDAGYVALFVALGLPAAPSLGATFCLIKRSREALWCLLGAGCFLIARTRPERQLGDDPCSSAIRVPRSGARATLRV